ncbi:MAG TPA: GNAT family N-acetyltransferase, partial [Candidatus Eisenbacteria bacterium]|nr:GNAT family N-acetyltransferase [Candidatus Eisenbacteria bacterium]
AFDGLDAEYARSTAHSDNAASLGVSRKLGYVDDGIDHLVVCGQVINAQRLLLDRATWQARRPARVRVSGLEPCLPWFGHDPAPAAAGAGR